MSPGRGFGTSCLLHCGRLTVSANSQDSFQTFSEDTIIVVVVVVIIIIIVACQSNL